jgi:hypothetical protein
MLKLTVDVSSAISGLNDFQRRQVPYAMSRSLNSSSAKTARGNGDSTMTKSEARRSR